MAQKIPAQSGTWNDACSWATNVLAIAPASGQSVVIDNAYNFFNSGGTISVPYSGAGAVGTYTTQVGDYVAVCIATVDTNTVTAPTGWTLVQAPAGTGTHNVKLWAFVKVMASGDLPGPATFTLASHPNTTDAVGTAVVMSKVGTTPLNGSNHTASTADGTSFATADLLTTVDGCVGLILVGGNNATAAVLSISSFTATGLTGEGNGSSPFMTEEVFHLVAPASASSLSVGINRVAI